MSADLAEPELPEHLSFVSLGTYRIRDWSRVERLFGVNGPDIVCDFPPLRIWGDVQRALMTVVVVDEVGATAKLERMSEHQVIAEQRSLSRTIRETFEESRGNFLKMLGDGGLALFDDPMSGLAFARGVVDRANGPMRIGIDVGVVELVGDDVEGSPIHKAFRLYKQAEPGQILVTRVFEDLVKGCDANFVPRADGLYALSGLSVTEGT